MAVYSRRMSRKFFQGAAGWLAGEFVSTWVWAPAITAVGVMIGLLQELTLFYLYIAAVFLFAAASTGLLRFSEWRYRNSVANKLAFHSVNIGKGVNKKGEVIAIRLAYPVYTHTH